MNNLIQCKQCGRPLKPGSRYCFVCGSPVTAPNDEVLPTPPPSPVGFNNPILPQSPYSPVNTPGRLYEVGAPPTDDDSSRKRMKMIILALAALLIVSVIIILVLFISRKNDESQTGSTDDGYYEESGDNTYLHLYDDEFDEYGSEPEEAVTIEPEAEAQADLRWLPQNFTRVFDVSHISALSLREVDEIRHFAGDDDIELSGHFSDYPIEMQLRISADGSVSGRYAYLSTLNKYGRGDSSWFKFSGQLLGDNAGRVYMGIVTVNPEMGSEFEYALLECEMPRLESCSGRICNVRYINNPNGHWYYINLNR